MGKIFTGRRKLSMGKNANNKLFFLLLFSERDTERGGFDKVFQICVLCKDRKVFSF
jgi:hypothetical protein